MSTTTIPQDSNFDKLGFIARGWLNWAVVAWGIARENLRRWPASWLADVAASGMVTVLLVPAWALYRLGALVGKLARIPDSQLAENPALANSDLAIAKPYATIPVSAGLVLEIRTEPPALWIRKDGTRLEVEPGELMKLSGMLTIAAGGLSELLATKGILWER